MSPEALERFHRQVAELEGAARVPRMRDSVQHGRVSTWAHCVRVAKAAVGIIDTTIEVETNTVSALRPNADLRIPITFLSVAIDVHHQAPDVGTVPTFQAVMQANPLLLA